MINGQTVTLEPWAYADGGGLCGVRTARHSGFDGIPYPNDLLNMTRAYVLSIPVCRPGNQWRLQHNAGWQQQRAAQCFGAGWTSVWRPGPAYHPAGLPPCGHLHDGHPTGYRIPNVRRRYFSLDPSTLRSDPHLRGHQATPLREAYHLGQNLNDAADPLQECGWATYRQCVEVH